VNRGAVGLDRVSLEDARFDRGRGTVVEEDAPGDGRVVPREPAPPDRERGRVGVDPAPVGQAVVLDELAVLDQQIRLEGGDRRVGRLREGDASDGGSDAGIEGEHVVRVLEDRDPDALTDEGYVLVVVLRMVRIGTRGNGDGVGTSEGVRLVAGRPQGAEPPGRRAHAVPGARVGAVGRGVHDERSRGRTDRCEERQEREGDDERWCGAPVHRASITKGPGLGPIAMPSCNAAVARPPRTRGVRLGARRIPEAVRGLLW